MGRKIRVNGRLYEAMGGSSTKEERIVDYLEGASDTDLLYAWKNYCSEYNPDGEVFEMDDFSEVFEMRDDGPWEAVRAAYYGDFRPTDEYFWFDGYGNLESANDLGKAGIDVEEIAEYCVEHNDPVNDDEIENILNGDDDDDEDY